MIIKGLTLKQARFIKELVKTAQPTEAAMRAFNCKSRLVARVRASQTLTKLNIKMPDIMEACGLDVQADIEDLKRLRKAKKLHICDIYIKDDNGKLKINKNSNDFIEVDDNQTQLKALELSLKLKGKLTDKIEHLGTGAGNHIVVIYPPGFQKKNEDDGNGRVRSEAQAVSSEVPSKR